MANALSNPIPWLVGGAVLALAGAFLRLAGSAMVIDETGGVASAVITDSGGSEQRLHRLWSGYFYAIPDMEGTIEIRCRNGVRKQWGYVTGHRHTKIRVVGRTPCARVIEAD
jgi:hypothetical protein